MIPALRGHGIAPCFAGTQNTCEAARHAHAEPHVDPLVGQHAEASASVPVKAQPTQRRGCAVEEEQRSTRMRSPWTRTRFQKSCSRQLPLSKEATVKHDASEQSIKKYDVDVLCIITVGAKLSRSSDMLCQPSAIGKEAADSTTRLSRLSRRTTMTPSVCVHQRRGVTWHNHAP